MPSIAQRVVAMAALIGERLLRESASGIEATRGIGGLSGMAYALWQLGNVTGDARYSGAARQTLRRAAHTDDVPLLGLFTGISGLRAVAALLAPEEPNLEKLVAQCDAFVIERLARTGATVKSFDDFDVLTGWSGIRLSRCMNGNTPVDETVKLLRWLITDDSRWCRLHPLRRDDVPENDLGLAHGVAGVLATLALTVDEPDDELTLRLKHQANALRMRAVKTNGKTGWPPYAQAPAGMVARPAWCYGAVGVGAALYWVGRRTYDRDIEQFAVATLEAHAGQNCAQWGFNDFALCHGTLGNALVFASVGRASGSATLLGAVDRAVEYVLTGLEHDGGACWGTAPDGQRYDYPGELNGAAGAALALLTVTGATSSEWLRWHALEPLAKDGTTTANSGQAIASPNE